MGDEVEYVRHDQPAVELVPVVLVPVEVFGVEPEDGYGLCDAVSAWSDCNRARGRIFRVDDVDQRYRLAGETVRIFVPRAELPKLIKQRWGDE